MAPGEEHITQTLLLFFRPHPLPSRQSQTEGKQSRVIQLPGAQWPPVRPHRQDGPSVPAFVRAAVRYGLRQHNTGENMSHTAKMETR